MAKKAIGYWISDAITHNDMGNSDRLCLKSLLLKSSQSSRSGALLDTCGQKKGINHSLQLCSSVNEIATHSS